jgi:hypothetical protein
VLVCGVLAAWTSAWLAGRVGPDDVVDAVTGGDLPHQVVGTTELDFVPLAALLVEWRRRGGPVRAVVPAPGDVRGLPGPPAFRSAALDAGQAAFGGGLGVVPELIEHGPSSAPPTMLWHVYEVEAAPLDFVQLGDAQYELGTAIRDCAGDLARAGVAGSATGIGDALHDARRAGERLVLPPGFPPRAVAMLAQAERLSAVLELAAADPVGGAIDTGGAAARRDALRPLETAVRRARLAGYNALSTGQ